MLVTVYARPVLGQAFKVAIFVTLEGVLRGQKMLKGHLPRVMYHQVY